MTPDWDALRRAYSRGGTVKELSGKWGVPESTLRGRIRREHWQRCAQTGQSEIVQKDEQNRRRSDRVDILADRMLTCLERAVEELDAVTRTVREKEKKEDGGDVTRDYAQVMPGEKGLIDRGGLKQLTGVLKDLKEILVLRSEGDTLEQQARIARLQRELNREDSQERILVTMEGACGDYAD